LRNAVVDSLTFDPLVDNSVTFRNAVVVSKGREAVTLPSLAAVSNPVVTGKKKTGVAVADSLLVVVGSVTISVPFMVVSIMLVVEASDTF